jgi:LysR family nitrogen assimilation transcriptional regulator
VVPLDIRQIRYFVRVVETGSVSRAAVTLRLSQPALGLQIRKLEVELGRSLLFRHSRGVLPTEDGRVLYERFTSILREIDSTSKYLANVSGPPRGLVSLGVTASMGLVLVPALVQLCHIELPQVTLRLVDGVSETILQGIEDGEIDLGLSGMRRDNGRLSCEPLMVEDMFLIGPRDHKAATAKPIRLAEAITYPLVLPTKNHPIRRLFDQQLQKHHLSAITDFELDSVILKKELVLQANKLTIMPFSAVYHEVRDGSIFARRIEKPCISDTMLLVSSERRPPTRAMLAVQKYIHRLVRQCIQSGVWRWRLIS